MTVEGGRATNPKMGNGTKKKGQGLQRQIFCKRPRLFTVAIPMEQHGVTQGTETKS